HLFKVRFRQPREGDSDPERYSQMDRRVCRVFAHHYHTVSKAGWTAPAEFCVGLKKTSGPL
ncbi:MAG TPA: hypothetical protein VFR05_03670, partial [Terriglobia bacterium]|nr:hypothetical protein [Terriglobia bacterium]